MTILTACVAATLLLFALLVTATITVRKKRYF